MKLSKQMFVN